MFKLVIKSNVFTRNTREKHFLIFLISNFIYYTFFYTRFSRNIKKAEHSVSIFRRCIVLFVIWRYVIALISIFQKLQEKFYEDPTDTASFIYGISDELRVLGILMIQETLEQINQQIRRSGKRKQSWVIDKNCHKKLLTSLGEVDFL